MTFISSRNCHPWYRVKKKRMRLFCFEEWESSCVGKDWGFTLLLLVELYTYFASTSSNQEVGLTRHIRATTCLRIIFFRYQPVALTEFFAIFRHCFFVQRQRQLLRLPPQHPQSYFLPPHNLRN